MKTNNINDDRRSLKNSRTIYGIVVIENSELMATLDAPHIVAPTRDCDIPRDFSFIDK
jgi:hypothetical protein